MSSKKGPAEKRKIVLKLSVVGDGAVGKTALLKNLSNRGFNGEYIATLTAEFYIAPTQILGNDVKLQFWDYPGQDRFAFFRSDWYRGSCAALLLFDLTRRQTFEKLPKFEQELKEGAGIETNQIIYAGTKYDLTNQIQVPALEAIEYVQAKEGMMYITTSALQGYNIVGAAQAAAITALHNEKIMWNKRVEISPVLGEKESVATPIYIAELEKNFDSLQGGKELNYISPNILL
jgi:small GTP-binding protein